MNVLVLGATGGTGRALVSALLDAEHSVSVFSRAAAPQPAFDSRVRVVQGDALAPADLDRAMPGHDAVVVSLGLGPNPFAIRFGSAGPTHTVSRGTQNTLAAMERHGVRRVIVVSAFGTGDSWSDLPLPIRMFFRLFLMASFRDKEVQEAAVRQSNTDWTILRPVQLTNGPETGAYLASPTGKAHGTPISRADVAHYAVHSLADVSTHSATVALSNR
ncbi:MAG: NAD(P)-binding oxidoreductase [Bacteroidota bacterium]